MLWYKLLSTKLEGTGFEINPYDIYVANKIIEGTQFTIAWYVDDNKLSHKNTEMVSDIINEVKKHFGELYILRGSMHNLLGMDIYIYKWQHYTSQYSRTVGGVHINIW